MTRVLTTVAIALLLASPAFQRASQTSFTSTEATGTTTSTNRPTEQSGDNLVLDGHAIVARSTKLLSSETAKVGDEVQFEVVQPVTVGGLVVIAEHAVATGRVVIAEKKKRRLRKGKLAVVVERVQTVTGQYVPVRSDQVQGVEPVDYGQHLDPGPAAILAAPAIILASHGSALQIPFATRAIAHVNGDLVLDRKKVEESQATLPKPRRDVGIVYIYRESGRDCPNCWTAISIGEALVGLFHPGQFIRLQLPAGRYWLRAPVPVRIGRTVDKDYLQRKRRGAGFLLVDVQPGHSYYVKEKTQTHLKVGDTELEQVDQATGADAVLAAQCWADMGLQDIAQELLPHLQASPTAERDKSH